MTVLDKQNVVKVVRLDRTAYEQLEKQLPKPVPGIHPEQTGYALGIQAVLAKLREGFVVGE